MTSKLTIGLVSAAHVHADAYADILKSMPDVELIGLADPDPRRGLDFAKLHSVPFLGDLRALLALHPDAVIVTSENANHRRDVEAAAAAGAHVLCEKPLATSVEDARAIIYSCAGAGVRLMTAFPMRFSPIMERIAAALAAGDIGPVHAVNAVNQGKDPSRLRAWFGDSELSGGGAVADHTVHILDLLRWLLQAEPTEVWATANHILHSERTKVETGAVVAVTFDDGTIATIDCSWSRPDNYPTWGGLGMELVGERGVLDVDAFRQRFAVYDRQDAGATWTNWGTDADRAMIRAFVDAARDGSEPPVTGLDGLRAVEVVQAAYLSLETGGPVRVAAADSQS
jgi:predicted dehydrogenase